MTATIQKRAKKPASNGLIRPFRGKELRNIGLAALSGAALGLSAPGFDCWWLAWVGLAPLLLLAVSSKGKLMAFVRGTVFGTAYNLVYQNWYLSLQPLDWLGFNAWQGWLLAGAAWFVVSFHQGLIIGLFAIVAKMLPTAGTFLPDRQKSKTRLPALVVLPVAWALLVEKLGNHPNALGVPLSMIQYTQYEQISLIQIASIIGGIGLGAFLVMSNATVAAFLATLSGRKSLSQLAAPNKTTAIYQCLAMAVMITGALAFGFWKSSHTNYVSRIPLSVVQSNINIDMQKATRNYSLNDVLARNLSLMARSPRGICVWTESALPTYLNRQPEIRSALSIMARSREMDLLIGAMDVDALGVPYNSAYGITSSGNILPSVYHKRYLVPFGEYEPMLVKWMPQWVKKLTNTPAGGGFGSGKEPLSLPLSRGRVGPLICFETISPEMASSTVRAGAQYLANISDLAWFHDSSIGREMIATSVMRAVENQRYFVFAANTGPSAIIHPSGRILKLAGTGQARILVGRIGLVDEITPFTRWNVF